MDNVIVVAMADGVMMSESEISEIVRESTALEGLDELRAAMDESGYVPTVHTRTGRRLGEALERLGLKVWWIGPGANQGVRLA